MLEKYLRGFVKAAEEHYTFIQTGEHKKVNKCHKQAERNLKKILDYGQIGKLEIIKLFDHPNIAVRFAAASYALHFDEKNARSVLESLIKGNGILGLQAKMIIDEWKAGNLRPLDNL